MNHVASVTPELKLRPDFDEQYCMAWLMDWNVVMAVRKESRRKLRTRAKLCDVTLYPECKPCKL